MSISSSWSPSLLPLNDNTTNEDDSSSSSHNNSNTTSPFQNLKPSILLILLILSITFLLSLSLSLLLRQLNRRCLRRLSPPQPSITVSSNRVSPHTHTDPAAFSIIDSLPLFTYSSIKRPSSASTADCAVCLSKFEPQDQLRLLPLCCHAFHTHCIDTWLLSNHTCPLCRSTIHASDSDLFNATSSDSFRLEIGSISRRQAPPDPVVEPRTSYSLGTFDYIVDDESEVVTMTRTHSCHSVSDKDIGAPVSEELNLSVGGGGRGWLKDYVDRLSNSLSSRTLSFRSSGRFFTGSSRRSEVASIGDYDMEANRVGEEISEMFRWFSGV